LSSIQLIISAKIESPLGIVNRSEKSTSGGNDLPSKIVFLTNPDAKTNRMKRYWLLKTEPETYCIDDLVRDKRSIWEGVRNYQARNFLRDDLQVGDQALFYHSKTKTPGVAGVVKIVRAGYPDPTQWDKKSKYFDKKAASDKPIWYAVDVELEEVFDKFVTLRELKQSRALDGLMVLKKGMMLSIQPVEKHHFELIVYMGKGSDR
jgi:predicted RNA-binding protein with PUA-like domain